MLNVWFWQRIVSPHMAGLAAGLAREGCAVTYVAEQVMSDGRARQGWSVPDLDGARLDLAPSKDAVNELVTAAPADSIHICQGVRGNGLVERAQRVLAKRGLRQWVVMETVDDSGWRGVLKRFEYWRLFTERRGRIDGVLAIGKHTPYWVAARGVPAERVFPFAYFLPVKAPQPTTVAERTGPFRFIFVGQLIERKRLGLLIAACARLSQHDVELVVIGSGPLQPKLQTLTDAALPGHVIWCGPLPIGEIPHAMASADCLVLPSRFDGWGAVVSEALMAGTPAICSDRCGSAEAVLASGFGGVFPGGDVAGLAAQLERMLARGRLSDEERGCLAAWGRRLGAEAGATYLKSVLEHSLGRQSRPSPPWSSREWPENLFFPVSLDSASPD